MNTQITQNTLDTDGIHSKHGTFEPAISEEQRYLIDVAATIESLKAKKFEIDERIKNVRIQQINIETAITEEVLGAKDQETGKKKYSNDKEREVARVQALDADPDYQQLLETERSMQRESFFIAIKVERLERVYRVVFEGLRTLARECA